MAVVTMMVGECAVWLLLACLLPVAVAAATTTVTVLLLPLPLLQARR